MNSSTNIHFGCEDLNERYMDDWQLDNYTNRVFKKGINEVEQFLIHFFFNTKDTILDVGTGCGRFAINAYKIGFTKMYAIDMNVRFINRAIEISNEMKYDIKFINENAIKTTFPDNTFRSVIFTSDGFSQVPGNENKLSLLNEMYRIMKPDSVLILAVIDENLVRENSPVFAEALDNFRESESWKEYNFYDKNDMCIYDGGYMHFATVDETLGLIKQTQFENENIINITAKDILGRKDKRSSNFSRYFILKK